MEAEIQIVFTFDEITFLEIRDGAYRLELGSRVFFLVERSSNDGVSFGYCRLANGDTVDYSLTIDECGKLILGKRRKITTSTINDL
ncbi:hypothetical protein CO172_03845 [Candidatus Uhrbacteria bacterium CG_4_9_14_3_um_filter_36_7]|uniref:Uncharacterized protein n=1 Tax=Candidatus Uhrbacteria bacterium CG_4_9_14_3_um_filter_36_7 TaxID=1975033 RepID=A0A2M7XEP8_9BACT|nr:MAG: hypothetical protein CO172_03845 [Candidatus Uhrbacteria bacterium CG_4_9_14_3_um_filter_36_7]